MKKIEDFIKVLTTLTATIFGWPAWVFKLLPKKYQGYKTVLYTWIVLILGFLETNDMIPIIDTVCAILIMLKVPCNAVGVKVLLGLFIKGMADAIRLETKTPAFVSEAEYKEELKTEIIAEYIALQKAS